MAFNLDALAAHGEDVYIDEHAAIRRPHLVAVGNHVAIDYGCYVTTALRLGDYIHLGPYSTVIGGERGLLTMGNFAGMAAGCRIICGSEAYQGEGFIGPTVPEKYHDRLIIAPVTIKDFATLATNVIVMPGVTIGEGSVVGAGSIVTKSTRPWTIYIGAPARAVKQRPRETILRYAKEMGYV